MNLLLDTNCLIWVLLDHPRLTQAARGRIQMAEAVHFSAAAIWEIGLKWRRGKINLPPRQAYEQSVRDGVLPLAVRIEDMMVSCEIAQEHPALFDRLFLAQAINHEMILVSSDAALAEVGLGRVFLV